MAGNVNNSLEERTVTTDSTPPTISIAYPTAGLNLGINTSIALNLSYDDADYCWYTIDAGVTNTSISTEVIPESLGSDLVTEGDFGNGGAAWDVEGEWGADGDYGEWVNDEIEDVDLYQVIGDGLTDSATYRVTFDVNSYEDDDSAYEVSLGGGSATAINSSGSKTHDIVAGASNERIAFSASTSDNTGDDLIQIDNVVVKLIIGEVAATNCQNTTIDVPEGSVDLVLYGNDSANNLGSDSVSFTADVTPPTVIIDYPTEGLVLGSSSINFNLTVTDALTSPNSCVYSFGGINYEMSNTTASAFNATNSSIADGSYTANFACTDIVGNSNNTESVMFVIDTTPPVISYAASSDAAGFKSVDNIFVNVSSSDSVGNISTFIDFDGSLVSWWRMDDANESANSVSDYTGRNNGTAQGGAVLTDAGYLGKGFSFDGDGDYVLAGSLDFDETGDYTYAGWFNSKKISALQNILDHGCGYDSNGFAIDIESSRLKVVSGFEAGYGSAQSSVLNSDEWYYFTVTYQNTDVQIYINAIADGSDNTDGYDDSGGGFKIGYGNCGSDSDAYFNGTLDDIMVFNRSLSATEIQALYANTSSLNIEKTFTSLSDDGYEFTAYVQDKAGNVNNSLETRTVTTDTIDPVIDYGTGTASNLNRTKVKTNVYVNVSVTETNEDTITFKLFYSNGTLINSTSYTDNTRTINWTGLSGEDYIYNVSVNDSAGRSNATDVTRAIAIITSWSDIVLNTGWNLISLTMKNTETETDRNVSLVQGWNLIGYDGDVNVSLVDATFHNGSNEYSFANAVAGNKLKNYQAYYDASSSLASERRFKYLGPSGVDDTAFRRNKGYWVYVNGSEGGNLTFPSGGGTSSGETYDVTKLRFSNGTDEISYLDAGITYEWISLVFQYWNSTSEQFESAGLGFRTEISMEEGLFVDSNIDNLTLIRQN